MSEFAKQTEILQNESILNREKINAPKGYVSVYHETDKSNLADIDKFGLQSKKEKAHYTINTKIKKLNKILEEIKPEKYRGLSRENVIFAYPFLETGHGMGGLADVKYNQKKMQGDFDMFKKFMPEHLKKNNINNFKEYYNYVIEEMQKGCKSVILELKIDPEKAFVGDLNNIEEARYDDLSEKEREKRLSKYWNNLVSLKDVIKYYKRFQDSNKIDLIDSEYFKGYIKIKDAPDYLPDNIEWPEILIRDKVEQKYIKVLK